MSSAGILDQYGKPIKANGKPRPDAIAAWLSNSPGLQRRVNASYDAARDSTEFANHWANSDALDADSSNSRTVRHKLMRRSRHEAGSNGIYDGILQTHCNMLIGATGPKLRMMSGSLEFNQLVEREFARWADLIQMRRKLWCMAHARYQDGESFGLLQTNPAIRNAVQLDFTLIEAEQCQTPFLPPLDQRYIDGIKYDEFNNVRWYDILPNHPGSAHQLVTDRPVRVSPREVLHWFKLIRPGAHRGVPALTSTLNLGASSRRMREATIAAVETAADLNVVATTQQTPDTVVDPMAPFSTIPIQKRMLTISPMGWDLSHFKSEHPNAQYTDFVRTQVSETARPLSMPFNAAMCDSSTYSFASGKLDFIAYLLGLDIERQDCAEMCLDRLFAAWFREWTILIGRRDIPPDHKWDWPSHPVIDAESEARATDTQLKNGTLSLRQHHSDSGRDYEDELSAQAEDTFGKATPETIEKMRQINVLRNTPSHAIDAVAQILGIETNADSAERTANRQLAAVSEELRAVILRLRALESRSAA